MSSRKFNRNTTALQVVEGIDLSGKVALITGANNGIGLETARALAYRNCHVIMACRNLQSAEEAKKSIIEGYPNSKIDILYMDSSKLNTVESCAAEYISKGWPLHMLILNAGVFNPTEKMTEDGFESTFQVNHLAHFYLTQLLSAVILKSAPARVVNVASVGHKVGSFNMDKVTENFLSPKNPRDVSNSGVTYTRSKFCNVLFSNELNRRWQDKGVTSNSLHPGAVRTQIARNSALGRFFFKLPSFGFEPVITMDKGAATTVYCATAPEIEGVGGRYFDAVKMANPSSKALEEETARKLWELSDQMIMNWKDGQTSASF
jgi:WW domain-containing oxidoreductase